MDYLSNISSVFSILGLPLAIYFYIKNKASRLTKVKAEIVRTLLFNLSSKNNIDLLEIKSVIGSKSREYNLKRKYINTFFVVEDLLTEIISNPLISKDEKKEYIQSLSETANIAKADQTYYKIATSDFIFYLLLFMGFISMQVLRVVDKVYILPSWLFFSIFFGIFFLFMSYPSYQLYVFFRPKKLSIEE